nr:venom metalloproteinase antarease TserMP_A-like [Dermacentor andersoni]
MLSLFVLLLLAACSCADKELFVYPTILEERTTAKNLVMRLTEEMTLNLKKSSILAETLLFVTSNEGSTQLEAVNTTSIEEHLYHDTHHQSSVMVHQRDGTVQVEGILNSNLRIKPLPEGERSRRGQMLHKLYEVQETKDNFKDSELLLSICALYCGYNFGAMTHNTRPVTAAPAQHIRTKDTASFRFFTGYFICAKM